MEQFNNLPKELKLRVLSFLPHHTLFSFRILNKEFRDLITNTGFQTNKIFNSYEEFTQKFPDILINFIKTASECPLDYAYAYLTFRGHPENIIVLRAELSVLRNGNLVENGYPNMRIYVKAKASHLSEKNQEASISNVIQSLRLSKPVDSFYQAKLLNSEFVRLLKNIKICQRLVVREKDEIDPHANVDHIPGPEVIELFSINPLFNRDPNSIKINNFINNDGIIDYDSINRYFTTAPMKTILSNSEKALSILNGYLESGLVLELHNMFFPVIETYEYINGNNNSNFNIKRTIRLEPIKQIDSFNIININNLNSYANRITITKLQYFVQELFRYICTCI
ncbi:hypothetical protein BCR32DRAFT_327144 [Anaeromyces robustus]|uniref:F-box domain-containing protein n=1 Tax=Anaeromyces robustus TaxID=1754192 RepID=A0A1Y1X7U3_9FUNG|nr:hypothetical protein BCR32DRAFT_327144 [Anaeromyces robustus]|eukprot:ORX81831.1 hypothetical protein BCR32DRAFT_327144 [Anaeromyces robustus]